MEAADALQLAGLLNLQAPWLAHRRGALEEAGRVIAALVGQTEATREAAGRIDQALLAWDRENAAEAAG